MAFKAVNNIAGLDSLVLTLLIFGTYPWIITDSLLLPSQQQRANALAKAIIKLCKVKTQREVQDAFNIRNGPDTIQTLPLALSLGSKVWIYREKKRWTGPFKVLDIADTDITIDTENEPVNFRNMYVRPYNCQIEKTDISHPKTANNLAKISVDKSANEKIPMPLDYPEPQKPCRRG